MSHCPLLKTTPISGYSAALYRLVALFVLCLGLVGAAHGQNSRYDGIVWSRNGFPSPGASVAVCTHPAAVTTTPPYCSNPAPLCSSLTDAVCTSPNPVTADSMGNFHYYAPYKVYDLESYNNGLTPFAQPDQILPCAPGISCTLGAGTFVTLTSTTANAALTGQINLAKSDCIKFRNNLNLADISGLCLNGSDQVTAGSGPFAFPSVADTAVGKATTDILTNKTLTSPVINGSPTGTGIPTLTLKKGSGGGNYTSASTTYVRPDSTNLAYTVTIPTGWKLTVAASGSVGTATAAATHFVALADGSADNTGILVELQNMTSGASVLIPFSLGWVIAGDGASHTINLQYRTSNGADSILIANSSATLTPTMTFTLSPSQ